MKNQLSGIDFSRYERLLKETIPSCDFLTLLTTQRTTIWSSEEEKISAFSELENRADFQGWLDEGKNLDPYFYTNNKKLIFINKIQDVHEQDAAYIEIATDISSSDADLNEINNIKERFITVSLFIQNEYRLLLELNDITEELSERYDELNLVYDTEDQVYSFDECHDALKELVRNACEYLDVPYGIVFMPLINQEAEYCTNDDFTALGKSNLMCRITDRFNKQRIPIVINKSNETSNLDALVENNLKLLASPVQDAHDSILGSLALFKEDTQRDFSNSDKNLIEVLSKKITKIILTHYDDKTHLMKREGLESYLANLLLDNQSEKKLYAVFLADIDNLQVINENFGNDVGDKVISAFSTVLKNPTLPFDFLSYLGNGKFCVVVKDTDHKAALNAANEITKFSQSLAILDSNHPTSVSIGYTVLSDEKCSVQEVINQTELACQKAKESGQGQINCYQNDSEDLSKRNEQQLWVNKIQTALQNNEFTLYAQSIVPLSDKTKKPHYEILLRLLDQNNQIIPPFEFIPAAERYNLMPQIDLWVIANTLSKIDTHWTTLQNYTSEISINLSGQTINNPASQSSIKILMDKYPHLVNHICFEITETAAVNNLDQASDFIKFFSDMGVSFSLDDFGAGMSSFNYLKELQIDTLKIDGGLVKHIVEDPLSKVMVSSIKSIADVMEVETIAEFVEDQAISDTLESMGIGYAQGYHYSKPIPFDDVIQSFKSASRFQGKVPRDLSP